MQLTTAYPAGGHFQLPFSQHYLEQQLYQALLPTEHEARRQTLSHHLACSQTLFRTFLCFQKKPSETLASLLCSVYLKAFNLLDGGFPIPILSDILVSHSHNTAKAPDHKTVHGPALNQTHLPAITAQIISVSTGRPHYFFILLKIKQRKTLQNTTSQKIVLRGALI